MPCRLGPEVTSSTVPFQAGQGLSAHSGMPRFQLIPGGLCQGGQGSGEQRGSLPVSVCSVGISWSFSLGLSGIRWVLPP